MSSGKTYEEYLAENGTLTYTFSGVSMNPMLKQGRDLFTVKAKTAERCRKYDVVLYRRPPSHYVLHRVVKVRKHDYVILGDNCIAKEYGITDDDILGVLTEFVRAGKRISAENRLYRFYARVWYALYPLRILVKKGRRRFRRGSCASESVSSKELSDISGKSG